MKKIIEIKTGDQLQSESLRTLEPVPLIVRDSAVLNHQSDLRLARWLVEEATEEAESTANALLQSRLAKLDAEHLTPADVGILNRALFDCSEGPRPWHLVADTTDRIGSVA